MTPFVVAGKYHAVSLLGVGGMGAVYDAIHQTTGRRVALKLLRDERVPNPLAKERFLREARLVGGLSSPFIAGVLDAGTDEGGTPYLAMEFVEGIDLKDYLEQRRRLGPDEAVRIAREICQGLAVAHDAGIVHRDVKPANVRLVTNVENVVAKLLDFGVAKELGADGALTVSGDLVGSPLYMAPEQFGTAPVDARTDVWGVGLLLYECLTGEPLHPEASTLGARAFAVLRDPAPDVRTRSSLVSEPLARVVARALAIDPSQRYADGRALDAALAEVSNGHASDTTDAFVTSSPALGAPPGRARSRLRWLVAGGSFAVVFALGAALILLRRSALDAAPALPAAEPAPSIAASAPLAVPTPPSAEPIAVETTAKPATSGPPRPTVVSPTNRPPATKPGSRDRM